jgi:hypothetical protein
VAARELVSTMIPGSRRRFSSRRQGRAKSIRSVDRRRRSHEPGGDTLSQREAIEAWNHELSVCFTNAERAQSIDQVILQ